MPPTADVFLGLCLKTPRGGIGGKIRPLARIKKRPSGGDWIADRGFDPLDVFGPSGQVFWYWDPPVRRTFDGAIVRFSVEEDPRFLGTTDPTKHWYELARRTPETWEIEDASVYLLSEVDVRWRQGSRLVRGLPSGAMAYVQEHLAHVPTLVGPWKVVIDPKTNAGCLEPKWCDRVFHFPTLQQNDDRIVTWTHSGQSRQCLLSEPDVTKGQPVDLSTPEQLASWLINRLRGLGSDAVAALDQFPGWEKGLQEDVGALAGHPHEIALNCQRWERIGPILEHVHNERGLLGELVLDNPRFRDLLKRAVEVHVESRRQEIEEEAAERAVAGLNDLERARAEEEQGGRRLLEELEGEIERRRTELEDFDRELVERSQALVAKEAGLRSAADHFEQSRERLIRDFYGFFSLLSSTDCCGVMPATAANGLLARNGPIPGPLDDDKGVVARIPDQLPIGTATPEPPGDNEGLVGPAVADSAAFVARRLAPCLAGWVHDMTEPWARLFHSAVLGCRWVLVPGTAWARAYAEAMGGTARLSVVTVEPCWLRFRDAWEAVEDFWSRAHDRPDRLHLLTFTDVNRSLPQCWAGPWLDLLAGFRDDLPAPASGLWPDNLRVLATLGGDRGVLELDPRVARHWAAIPKGIGQAGMAFDRSEGHVEMADWHSWRGDPTSVDRPLAPDLKELGDLARAAALDLARIRRILVAHGLPEEPAEICARRVRIEAVTSDYLG
jgi:hypothetical protein